MTVHLRQLRVNVGFSVAEFGATTLAAFVGYRLLIEAGGIASLGLWSLLYAAVSLFRFCDLGLANAVLREAAVAPSGAETCGTIGTAFWATAVWFGVVSLLGTTIVAVAIGWLAPAAHQSDALLALPWVALALYLFALSGVLLAALQGLHHGALRSTIAMAGAVVQLVLALALVPAHGVAGFAVAQVIQYGVVLASAWLTLAFIAGPFPVGIDRGALRRLTAFGRQSQAASITAGLFEPMAKLLVGAVGGLHLQGLFELAYKTVWVARNLAISGLAAVTPALTTLAATDRPGAIGIFRAAERHTTFAAVTAVGAAVLLSPLLSMHWLGELDFSFCAFTAMLAVGAIFSAAAAPASILALVTGVQRFNIAHNLASIAALAVAAALLPAPALVAAVAAIMGLASVSIRRCNAPLLLGSRP